MKYDVVKQLFYFVVPLLLFVSVWVKHNTVTLYSRYPFTRILQTAQFNCCTVWLFNVAVGGSACWLADGGPSDDQQI